MIESRKKTVFKKAVFLRQNGYSYGMIQNALDVPKGTLSYWLREVPIKKIHPEVAQRVKLSRMKMARTKQRRQFIEIEEMRRQGFEAVGAMSQREFWLAGVALYWAEGAKAFEDVSLTNSDPDTIRFYIKWLRECCKADPKNLRVGIHIYPDIDPEKAKQYWKKITGVSLSQFYKVQIDRRSNKHSFKQGRLPYGTAHVRLGGKGGRRLHRLMIGWINGLKFCGGSSVVERGPSKSDMRVRFPSPAQVMGV